ncbi:MAG: DUF523 and DUF1722 domain-containing protein [Desulfuromonadaceae bacterium]|nr:DUF523 and DUF1722 domain-containing protein [Desulfuromonadaceae bacterium]
MCSDLFTRGAITLGISSCLLGEHVRYDGGHKLDHYIVGTLGRYFRFLPICPEVGCGLPIPREPMHLEGDSANPRLMTIRTRIDLTAQMLAFCTAKVKELEDEDLCGFIFKKDSPSSGLFNVKVYNNGVVVKSGSGLFAEAMARHFPLLPMEEEGRLSDPKLRENFIERVFCYRRWKDFLASGPTLGRLVEFHTAQKLLIMAHSPKVYYSMGSLVGQGRDLPLSELLRHYEEQFMKGMALHATTKKNTNVLQHMMGYFKQHLSAEEKVELLEVIGQYHDNLMPLIAPLTLIRHYVFKYNQQYLKGQFYLSPHPVELMLRNHV